MDAASIFTTASLGVNSEDGHVREETFYQSGLVNPVFSTKDYYSTPTVGKAIDRRNMSFRQTALSGWTEKDLQKWNDIPQAGTGTRCKVTIEGNHGHTISVNMEQLNNPALKSVTIPLSVDAEEDHDHNITLTRQHIHSLKRHAKVSVMSSVSKKIPEKEGEEAQYVEEEEEKIPEHRHKVTVHCEPLEQFVSRHGPIVPSGRGCRKFDVEVKPPVLDVNFIGIDEPANTDTHTHSLTIPIQDLFSHKPQTYVLSPAGNPTHTHTVQLHSEHFYKLQNTRQPFVDVFSSIDQGHEHIVRIRCAE